MYRSVLLACLVSVAAAQYFYPIPESDSGEYVELIRVPRSALQPNMPPPNRAPAQLPFYPSIQAKLGGVPMPQSNRRVASPYEPMASSSKKEPLVTAESHGHGSHHGHDYVDYGAYTGGWGAFGWYSDHPVHSHGY